MERKVGPVAKERGALARSPGSGTKRWNRADKGEPVTAAATRSEHKTAETWCTAGGREEVPGSRASCSKACSGTRKESGVGDF